VFDDEELKIFKEKREFAKHRPATPPEIMFLGNHT
jgi:hypothetical protein